MVDQVRLFFKGTRSPHSQATFGEAKRAVGDTKPNESVKKDAKEEVPNQGLAQLGQMLLRRPQMNPPLAPRVVGSASQTQAFANPQGNFQLDPQILTLLSTLMGRR
jgi:hypothetical protein